MMGVWGLQVTNYGEVCYKTGEGGHVKFYPYGKGGSGKSFSHAKGGAQTVLGYFLCGILQF